MVRQVMRTYHDETGGFRSMFGEGGSLELVLNNAIMSAIPVLICITIHELAHGYTAYRLGDRTAKDMGRLTLNPLKHLDLFGTLALLLFQFGWANRFR